MKNKANMKENNIIAGSTDFETKKLWLESELSQRLSVPRGLDKLIFIGLTNRTNTGALATTLGRSPVNPPITRHIQPFKAIARQLMETQGVSASTPLTFFKSNIELADGINIVKETIGPADNNPAEWVDAIKILISRGVDMDKLVFIPTFRDVFDTVASWKFMWKWNWEKFPFDSFNKSFEFVSEKIDFAQSHGIKVIPYVHEFIRDFTAKDTIRRMCQLIGIPYHDNMILWENNNSTDQEKDWYFEGNIVKYDQPPDRWIRGVLNSAHGGRGQLIWRPMKARLQLTEEERHFVEEKIPTAIEIQSQYTEYARSLLGL